ncbi:MAG TPA: DUF134 domain-containing protein [Treponemataceae bacterium]|nr:DUF134 domain-containing protein [Treponemataceae bacterium]
MSRPRKIRRISELPRCTRFYPQKKIALHNINKNTCFISATDTKNSIIMSIEEYETIRLIDYKNFTQEECAVQMNVARTSVTAMYNNARKKIALSLVESRILEIDGGDYMECQGRFCHNTKEQTQHSDDTRFTMKLAVPCNEDTIFQRFGLTGTFKMYSIEHGKIIKTTDTSVGTAEHRELVDFLLNEKIDSLLCGGIGNRAKDLLLEAGIIIYSGVSGNANAKVQELLDGKLNYFLDFPLALKQNKN